MSYPLKKVLPNSFIKVVDGAVVGAPFTLPKDYPLPSGGVASNVESLTATEKRALRLYPVVETLPDFDDRYQTCEPIYTLSAESVSLTYAVTDIALISLKQAAIAKAYRQCAGILDEQSKGYSVVEIATFPLIQAEILAFNATGSVGDMMQAVINRHHHSAQSLSDLLMPKITIQAEALLARDNHVVAIMALNSGLDVADYVDLNF